MHRRKSRLEDLHLESQLLLMMLTAMEQQSWTSPLRQRFRAGGKSCQPIPSLQPSPQPSPTNCSGLPQTQIHHPCDLPSSLPLQHAPFQSESPVLGCMLLPISDGNGERTKKNKLSSPTLLRDCRPLPPQKGRCAKKEEFQERKEEKT